MKSVIKGLKDIIKKYKTCLDNNLPFRFSDRDLDIIKKSIIYLTLIDDLADNYKGDKNDN